MKIGIDLRPLMSGKISGVEVYIISMLKALFEVDQKNEYILWYNCFKKVNIAHFPTKYSNVKLKRMRIPNKLLNLSLSLLRWPKIDRLMGEKIDVLWVPDPRPAPVSETCKKIITFHDLSFEDFKHSFNLKTRLWHKVLRPQKEAEEADFLVAVSAFTKQQLVDAYHIHPDKIHVIHEAADGHLRPFPMPKAFEIIQRKYQLPDRYFLCLSTLEPRKNVKGVIEAYLDWHREVKGGVKLVIAGKRYPRIFAELKIEQHPDILMTGFVDEEDKGLLYENALAFLYPSFYEGFGLPILEAMQCGVAVVTSDITAMPEVAGDAALLINPNDTHQLKEAMHKLYRDNTYREELIKKGLKRAEEFSWKKAANELLVLLGLPV